MYEGMRQWRFMLRYVKHPMLSWVCLRVGSNQATQIFKHYTFILTITEQTIQDKNLFDETSFSLRWKLGSIWC